MKKTLIILNSLLLTSAFAAAQETPREIVDAGLASIAQSVLFVVGFFVCLAPFFIWHHLVCLRRENDQNLEQVNTNLLAILHQLSRSAPGATASEERPGLAALQEKVGQFRRPARPLPTAPAAAPAPVAAEKIRCPDCQSEFPAPANGTRALCPTCGVSLEIIV